jgi:oxygen-independent coproporphyrinogen-3 oxidase
MDQTPPPLSLYVHLPWCVRKCPYCDFNSHSAGDAAPFDRYIDALVADIRAESPRSAARSVHSIFLGGGTPSLFRPEKIETILTACSEALSLADDCEITMEANPGTVEHGSLAAYRRGGVTRLSIGAQSFDPEMLAALGRIHGPQEIVATFREAERAGFDSINVDLMFALPGQTVDRAVADVERLTSLSPSHASYYQLTLEPNTVFYQRPPANIPDDDLAWAIQERGHRALADAGYEQYEISAFAREGHRCRHNLNYWQFGDYLAVGAGAHGKLTNHAGKVSRYQKPANPMQFMEQAGKDGVGTGDAVVGEADLAFEFMLNVLRLSEGFTAELFSARTGLDVAVIAPQIDAAVVDGLLKKAGAGAWRPTADGFRFLNELQGRLLP